MQDGSSRSGRGWAGRVARIGALASDSDEEALRKGTLVLFVSFTAVVSSVWVATYFALGLYLSAAIPLGYQAVSVANLAVFAKTKRYRFFRACELGLGLVLPFLLQLSLGGFVNASAIVLWSFSAPLGALLFSTRRAAAGWFGAFVAVVGLSVALDPLLPQRAEVTHGTEIALFAVNILGVTGTSYVLLQYFVRERDLASAIIAAERERSDRLLLNVLPEPIAERLKSGESQIADRVGEAGVLFADLVQFTALSETLAPEALVRLLDDVFTLFDGLVAEHRLEKIKTIGDAYMVASGLLGNSSDHAEHLAKTALEMQEAIGRRPLQLRIGIDIGPVVAGVIGRRRFIYDLWGDTVNTASRMESHGLPGTIQVTERAYRRLASTFAFRERGIVEVKGKGPIRTYLLVGTQTNATSEAPARSRDDGHGRPSDE
jgi:class 3 adenylate cyclase